MNIHEYQAKQLFDAASVAVPAGAVAQSPDEFDTAIASLPEGSALVVKAQIHAGGRGKGTFKDGFQGGVHVVDSPEVAKEKAAAMLGNVLVTKQTGEVGREVRTVYFTEAVDIAKEFYLAILMDRATSKPVIIASLEGGVDIEEVAENSPEKIIKVTIEPTLGLRSYQAREIAFGLQLTGDSFKQCVKLLNKL
jgi:succinyl-CoA synthetase beta subunit